MCTHQLSCTTRTQDQSGYCCAIGCRFSRTILLQHSCCYQHSDSALSTAHYLQAIYMRPPDTYTVENGDVAPAAAWLGDSLATAKAGSTAYMLFPGRQAQASVQQLRTVLLAGGCFCSLNTPDLLVFDYIGYVGGLLLPTSTFRGPASARLSFACTYPNTCANHRSCRASSTVD
jgi:hypothetical protein